MFGILDSIEEWLRELLIGIVQSNLSTLFESVNTKVGTIATEVAKTPSTWNASIYSMVRSLSENVMLPIAGIIITYVLCYELISMIMDKNTLHDVDTFMFFKYLFKACIMVFIVSNTFTITLAVFDLAQSVVNSAGSFISGSTSIDITSTIASMTTEMETMELGSLVMLVIETMILSLSMRIMSILITVILYGRMIEIYLTVSIAPIPFSTLGNREMGQIGTNYIKTLFALGFQGFLMMVCVAIYAILVKTMTVSTDIHAALFEIAAYTVLLCFTLLKTGSLSKSLFSAH